MAAPCQGGRGDEQVDTFTQVSKDMLTGRLYLSAKEEVGQQHGRPLQIKTGSCSENN